MTDYYAKYIKYKLKYLQLKEQIEQSQIGGKKNICSLPKDAKLFFGSGGSTGIIAILPKGNALKYFPVISASKYKKSKTDSQNDYNNYEIQVIKELTKNVINKNLTPHIITYINDFKCNHSPNNIFKDCPSYTEYLLSKKKSSKKCDLIYKGHPKIYGNSMCVLEMEKAKSSLSDELVQISKKSWPSIESFLDKLIFQVFYTLESIKLVYPNYTHNDLFIRNILTKENKQPQNSYFRYYYKKYVFDVPANGVFIAFNDFGMNVLNQTFLNKNNIKEKALVNPYREYFAILFDVYNGGNLGGSSLYKLIKDKDNLYKLDKYFKKFINVKVIKKIIKNNKKSHLDWDWNKLYDKEFTELMNLNTTQEYINYFLNKYPKDDSHNIVREFGK